MMFFHENKKLILGAAVGLGIWLCVVFMGINSNWAVQAQKLKETETARQNWDGYFIAKTGPKQMPKKDAENEIELSNAKLKQNLGVLQHLEFGTPDTLRTFQEAAAGSGDKKSYFIQQRTLVEQKATTQWHLKVPPDLDMVSRADDPVSLNLMRLALVDKFLLSCQEANIQRVTKIKYDTPTVIEPPEIKADPNSKDKDAKEAKYDPKTDASKKGGKPAPAPEAQDKLIQFPIRVTVIGPERAVAQLLFEVQKQTVHIHGYFCINSVRVEINDAATGTVRGTLALSGLLSEKQANDMQIKLKTTTGGSGTGGSGGDDDTRPSRNVDPDKY